MDLSKLFNDDRVTKRKTHIVMKSVGVPSTKFKGFQVPPTVEKNKDGAFSPAHALFPVTSKKDYEAQGWVEVKPVPEPTDAKAIRKTKDNVEG